MMASAPPQPYAGPELAPHLPPDDGGNRGVLSYEDFTPKQLTTEEVNRETIYEPFSTLIERANEWLKDNRGVKVKACESIATQKWSHDGRHMMLCYNLRLWVVPKGAGDSPAPQEIAYRNVTPLVHSKGGYIYADGDETFSHLNEMFRANPLPGRIVNVETIDVPVDGMTHRDPDQPYWCEDGQLPPSSLGVVRVFYEVGPPCPEEIGSLVFVPPSVSGDNQENLAVVLKKGVNAWIQQNPNLPVCNIQSSYCKPRRVEGGQPMDTQRFNYCCGRSQGEIIRMMIVYYVKGTTDRQPVKNISYKTFAPEVLPNSRQRESMIQCMDRARAWLKLTNASVMGCETQAVRMIGGNSVVERSEITHFDDSGNGPVVDVIRVFLNGFYE